MFLYRLSILIFAWLAFFLSNPSLSADLNAPPFKAKGHYIELSQLAHSEGQPEFKAAIDVFIQYRQGLENCHLYNNSESATY